VGRAGNVKKKQGWARAGLGREWALGPGVGWLAVGLDSPERSGLLGQGREVRGQQRDILEFLPLIFLGAEPPGKKRVLHTPDSVSAASRISIQGGSF